MRQRKDVRLTRRLEAAFSAGGLQYRGISSNLSRSGIFIRTQNSFVPGTIVDIELFLPDQPPCRLRGKVKRAIKTPLKAIKNGMGVELIQPDRRYLSFLQSIGIDISESDIPSPGQQEQDPDNSRTSTDPGTVILVCPSCSSTNRLPHAMLSLSPACGRCGFLLKPSQQASEKRHHKRYSIKLSTTVSAGDSAINAVTLDISEGGLFVTADKGFAPGSPVEIDLYLPDGKSCHIRGTVKRAASPAAAGKGGMGIELVDVTEEVRYTAFLKALETSGEPEGKQPQINTPDDSAQRQSPAGGSDYVIIPCASCNVKNKVPASRLGGAPKCGRCGAPLNAEPRQ